MVLRLKTTIRKTTSPLPFSPGTPVSFKIKPKLHLNINNEISDLCLPDIRENITIRLKYGYEGYRLFPLPQAQFYFQRRREINMVEGSLSHKPYSPAQ